MRKATTAVLLIMLALGAAACDDGEETYAPVAITLLRDDMPSADFIATPLADLALRDEPLLTDADIVSYDRRSHRFELTTPAYIRLQETFPLPVDVDGIPFVVTVGDELIYGGALYTPASSLSFDGVVLMQPFATDSREVGLALGYPSSDLFIGPDPRGDARIIGALAAAGKLR